MESSHRDPTHNPNPNPTTTAEEEALKRNTDCVYFLASPLTCKKGNDCEYRHSDGARMNPRDCWYWLNGNCMNPKCAFRHPPLEGFLGTTAAKAGSLAAPQAVLPMQMPTGYPPAGFNGNKQSVPCYYFQRGQCLKGDKCPFMHGPQPLGTPTPLQSAKVNASVSEPPQIFKKATGVLEKCTSEQKAPQVNAAKPVQVQPSTNLAFKAEIVPSDVLEAKRVLPPTPLYDEVPRTNPTNVLIAGGTPGSRSRVHQVQPPEEHVQNGREAGEFLGESSPGFDVLVDDEHEDSDYFHHEDEYGRSVGNGGRLNAMNEFDYDHPAEIEPLARFERESYNELRDYEQYGRTRDQYGWEHPKSASERMLDRPYKMDRRRPREESPDQIDRSDLRHRLIKQRKVGGSRHAISPDPRSHRDDRSSEEQRYHGRPQRDQRRFSSEISISSRLQGRIKLPGRSSPEKARDLHSDREMDRGRNRSRSSPGRPGSYHQGRQHDRSRRIQENFSTEVRSFRGQTNKSNEIGIVNFAGPKSLAELKGAKASDNNEDRSTKNNFTDFKNQSYGEQRKVANHLEPEGDSVVSFEGPKPLSEILKRKRAASGNGAVSSDGEDNRQRGIADDVVISLGAEAAETPIVQTNDLKEEAAGVNETGDEDLLVTTEGDDGLNLEKGDATGMESNMIDTMEDQEYDTYDQRDGEYDDETGEGGDYKLDDENAEPEDEYSDEDDGDDFSTKIGAMLS